MLKQAVLVTGVGRRVGFHLAHQLHNDGYTVIGQYRRHTEECEQLRQLGISLIEADFADTDQIMGFVNGVKQACSSLRAIVHNASSFEPTSADLLSAANQYEQFFL